MNYSTNTIQEAIDKLVCYALAVDHRTSNKKGEYSANPNYNSGCPYDKPGELVKSFLKEHPEISQGTAEHWQGRIK